MEPFADESASAKFDGLTAENRTDRVSLYGSTDLTRDKEGLARAKELHELLRKIIAALESDPALPERLPPPAKTDTVGNPFA